MKKLIQYPIALTIVAGLSVSAIAASEIMLKEAPNLAASGQESGQVAEKPEFEKIDTNKDSNISVEEAQNNSWLAKNFAIIDANEDGLITPVEFLVVVKDNA